MSEHRSSLNDFFSFLFLFSSAQEAARIKILKVVYGVEKIPKNLQTFHTTNQPLFCLHKRSPININSIKFCLIKFSVFHTATLHSISRKLESENDIIALNTFHKKLKLISLRSTVFFDNSHKLIAD